MKNEFALFADKLSEMSDKLGQDIEIKVRARSEILAGDARAACPVDTGDLRNSIEGFVEVRKDEITGGAVTTSDHAVYVEFGTGPVGTESGGHPLDDELGVVRKTEPWLGVIPNVGPRYIHGQKAVPYMYTAMKQNEEDILNEFSAAVKEVIKGD